ncbi:MAG: glutathione S-transferase N-terminal domain-containing protein [Gammaproteobacteria bacterium]|nr:glutathione S-transferase N-terminal domain-containing protein [Gammaproteobacteria bacterium]
MNAGLTLYLPAADPLGDWLHLVLAEKGIEGASVRRLAAGARDEDLLLLNPTHSLPTLVDRQGIITVPWVIAEYLDERYPHPPLMPIEPAPRARARSLLQEMLNALFPALGVGIRRGAAAAAITVALRDLAAQQAARRPWPWRGYTLLDCAWAVLLQRLQETTEVKTSEALQRYLRQLQSRPAWREVFGS